MSGDRLEPLIRSILQQHPDISTKDLSSMLSTLGLKKRELRDRLGEILPRLELERQVQARNEAQRRAIVERVNRGPLWIQHATMRATYAGGGIQ